MGAIEILHLLADGIPWDLIRRADEAQADDGRSVPVLCHSQSHS